MDAMIDIETLGTRPGCVVLTIGAVKFNPNSFAAPGPGLYLRPDIEEQVSLGREIQEDTVLWWEQQAEDVREEALSEDNRQALLEVTKEINRFLVGVNNIWAQGPAFDFVIMESLYRDLGIPTPWNFWQVRDSRTLFGVHGDPREKGKAGLHNALEDCVSQATAVQKVYHQIGKHNENRN
jgi:DNA polymerase III epsilon subunit-like protein